MIAPGANVKTEGPLPPPPTGLDSLERGRQDNTFKTTGTAAWPPQLCEWVAQGITMLPERLTAQLGRGNLTWSRSVGTHAAQAEYFGAPRRASP